MRGGRDSPFVCVSFSKAHTQPLDKSFDTEKLKRRKFQKKNGDKDIQH